MFSALLLLLLTYSTVVQVFGHFQVFAWPIPLDQTTRLHKLTIQIAYRFEKKPPYIFLLPMMKLLWLFLQNSVQQFSTQSTNFKNLEYVWMKPLPEFFFISLAIYLAIIAKCQIDEKNCKKMCDIFPQSPCLIVSGNTKMLSDQLIAQLSKKVPKSLEPFRPLSSISNIKLAVNKCSNRWSLCN